MQNWEKYSIGGRHLIGRNNDIAVEIIGKDDRSYTLMCDGYTHNISKFNIRGFKNTHQTMIDSDYLKYVNNKIFSNTEFTAIEKIESKYGKGQNAVVLLNNNNGVKYVCNSPLNAKIDVIRSITTRSERLKERVIEALGDYYDYSKTICIGIKGKSIVTCPEHGDFKIDISNTLSKGCGCPNCSKNAFKYGRSGFINLCNSKEKMGILYLIKCKSKNESGCELFYKIGITTRTAMERSWNIPYETKTILTLKEDPEYIYDLENVLHRKLSEFAYLPKIPFKGRTECFEFNDEDKIIEIINSYKLSK